MGSISECVDQYLDSFRRYDRAVDIVSIFEMLFTTSKTELPAQVGHFERFPVGRTAKGSDVTPDFTVLFNDGRALAGEIAYFPLKDEGVDALCDQIARYDQLTSVPSSSGLTEVEVVDVALLVPQALGPAAVKRVLKDRLLADEHFYKPKQTPVILQFGFDEGRYNIQRLLAAENGDFRDSGRPEKARLSAWLAESGINVKPSRFSGIKSSRAFVNDPVDDLYLATHLWSKSLASISQGVPDTGGPRRIEISAQELATRLTQDYGSVRVSDVVRALKLLSKAKLCEQDEKGTWVIAWEQLRPTNRDVAELLAERACNPPSSGPMRRLERQKEQPPAQPRPMSLFDE